MNYSRAIKGVHPDQFVDPLDAATVAQPRLVLLNRILGKENHIEKFEAVKFNDLVERISSLEQTGLIDKIVTLVGDDGVLVSLLLAAMHERHGTAKRDEVRRQAEFLLGCLGGNHPYKQAVLSDLQAVRQLPLTVQSAIASDVYDFITIASMGGEGLLEMFFAEAVQERRRAVHEGASSQKDPRCAAAALKEAWCAAKLGKARGALTAAAADAIIQEIGAFIIGAKRQP